MRGVVHHIDLTVANPDRSFAFYDAVLTTLGYRLARREERGFDWHLRSPLGVHSIAVVKASEYGKLRSHDRYSPGLHHVAWGVDCRDDVDRICEVVQRIGGRILDLPADYPQYNSGCGYYAVFFADPDGLKLECVYTPQPSEA
ncbi:MAG: VOC family protein [Hyphomicrobiaceae bacterium]